MNFKRDEVNNSILSEYQNNSIWPTFLYFFLARITVQAEDIIKLIQDRVPKYRNACHFRMGRRNVQFAQLRILLDIFILIGEEIGVLTEREGARLYIKWLNEMNELFQENENLGKTVSLSNTIIEAFQNLLDRSPRCLMAEEVYIDDISYVYQNADYYFINTKTLIEAIDNYSKKCHSMIECPSANQVIQAMKEEGLLMVKKEGGRLRSTSHLPGIPSGKRYLWIYKSRFNAAIKKIDDYTSVY